MKKYFLKMCFRINFVIFRCDISWYSSHTISPSICESVYEKDNSKTLYILLESSLIHFQERKDAAFVSGQICK